MPGNLQRVTRPWRRGAPQFPGPLPDSELRLAGCTLGPAVRDSSPTQLLGAILGGPAMSKSRVVLAAKEMPVPAAPVAVTTPGL